MKGKQNILKKILGTFDGMCADADITNENGLDITRPVWENVFASDEYKKAIELGHYIGFLGHPEDPGCQDFQQACIVMTNGEIKDDGKVYGSFNLVDTPVGRIVKSFIDAGVTFGISVRGAGDIVDNSVDPDTFVFRGFDLVAFPAYKDAIPQFTEIAASTDVEKRKAYKKVCAAVERDLKNITSSETLNVLKDQFPEQSETYAQIKDREEEISCNESIDDNSLSDEDRICALMKLYQEERKKRLEAESHLQDKIEECKKSEIYMSRKLAAITRITASQSRRVDEYGKSTSKLKSKLSKLENKNKTLIRANTRIKHINEEVKDDIEQEKLSNLRYKEKIEASRQELSEKDRDIADLESRLGKTVAAVESYKSKLSNRDKDIENLKAEICASEDVISEYQNEYADIYSKALGVSLPEITVTASTSVRSLRDKIAHATSDGVILTDQFSEPREIETYDGDDELITM